jgi:hypothetical protein
MSILDIDVRTVFILASRIAAFRRLHLRIFNYVYLLLGPVRRGPDRRNRESPLHSNKPEGHTC